MKALTIWLSALAIAVLPFSAQAADDDWLNAIPDPVDTPAKPAAKPKPKPAEKEGKPPVMDQKAVKKPQKQPKKVEKPVPVKKQAATPKQPPRTMQHQDDGVITRTIGGKKIRFSNMTKPEKPMRIPDKKEKPAEPKQEPMAKEPSPHSGGIMVAEDVSVKFSGQLRYRPEMQNNYDFNAKADDNRNFTGQRARLNFDVAVGSDITALIQVQDARYWGAINGSSQTTVNNIASSRENEALDLHQAWFQVNKLFDLPLTLKVGRQQLVYGSQRLIGHLGWQDQARAFDAYKLTVDAGPGTMDLFTAKLTETSTHAATGTADWDLGGLYTMWGLPGGNTLDVYYLLWTIENNGRNVSTYGFRLEGKYNIGLDYSVEYAAQGGDWTTGTSHSASAYAVTAGYRFGGWKTRLGVEYDHGSGDDGSDANTHKTFVFPFHTNHAHYGHMDMFSWGNMNNIAIKLETNPGGGKTKVKLDYHMLSLAEATDDWLNVVGVAPQWAGNAAYAEKEAGTEIDLTVVYPYNKHLKLVAGYSVFSPGKAAKERSGGNTDNADWGYLMFVLGF